VTGCHQMWDTLTPNLSKYTCCFSEQPWPETSTPTFPSLADMQQYLKDYANTYVLSDDDNKCTIHYGCTVTNVAAVCSKNDDDNDTCCYKVEWEQRQDEKNNDGSSLHSKVFDKVVVATGFFSTPVYPDGLSEYCSDINNNNNRSILHSSEYRTPDAFADLTVAVVGGSFSAQEIASDVVRQCAKHVISIVPNNMPYILPRYVNMGGFFMPLDYVLYRRKEDAPSSNSKIPAAEQIVLDDAACRQRHEMLGNLLGSRKRAQLAAKGIAPTDVSSSSDVPPMISISDDYLNLVIDGKIQVVRGRLARVTPVVSSTGATNTTSSYTIELEDGSTVATPVDRIIVCTGYRSRLDFLSPEIRETLQYDETDMFAPLTLCYDAFHPQLPGLGFVGMYKGPYFGYMELQARLLAGLFSGTVALTEQDVSEALQTSIDIRRHSQQRNAHRRPQFPHFDYIGMMDVLADKLGPEITVRVTYAYQCTVPLARQILCKIFDELEGQSEFADAFFPLAQAFVGGRFRTLQHETTLMIHDAPYVYRTEGA